MLTGNDITHSFGLFLYSIFDHQGDRGNTSKMILLCWAGCYSHYDILNNKICPIFHTIWTERGCCKIRVGGGGNLI